jgi:predicted DNA-binding protein YlxM (UPF0122 family)
MGFNKKEDLKLKARRLRKEGFSIREIEKKLKVSRSSVSLWVRNVNLTAEQKQKMFFNKKKGQKRGGCIAAINKKKDKERLIRDLNKKGFKEIGLLSKRDKFIAGIAMYFGEGDKTDGDVGFSNSDPQSIKFMMDWFREKCKVPLDKFRGSLYIHDDLDDAEAKEFWSKLSKIPSSNFTKVYKVKNNPNRLKKRKHPYGVFRIRVSDVTLHRRIMGWINGLLK